MYLSTETEKRDFREGRKRQMTLDGRKVSIKIYCRGDTSEGTKWGLVYKIDRITTRGEDSVNQTS